MTSIRTLEKQIRRFKSSEFEELREIGQELSSACAAPPECRFQDGAVSEPVAPTLARHADPDEYPTRLRADLSEWAAHHLPKSTPVEPPAVDLLQPADHLADICATLLYPVTEFPYRHLYELTSGWPAARRKELLDVALGPRNRHDELPRHFRSAPYVFDFAMDIGAYRDLHRHRRCQQFRQFYSNHLGYERPAVIDQCGAGAAFDRALTAVDRATPKLPQPATQYLLPFASRSRFLFKMDFAELEYISRLRSGVKGHFAYRQVAWGMREALEKVDPALSALVDATPPWIEDPLKR